MNNMTLCRYNSLFCCIFFIQIIHSSGGTAEQMTQESKQLQANDRDGTHIIFSARCNVYLNC